MNQLNVALPVNRPLSFINLLAGFLLTSSLDTLVVAHLAVVAELISQK